MPYAHTATVVGSLDNENRPRMEGNHLIELAENLSLDQAHQTVITAIRGVFTDEETNRILVLDANDLNGIIQAHRNDGMLSYTDWLQGALQNDVVDRYNLITNNDALQQVIANHPLPNNEAPAQGAGLAVIGVFGNGN